MKTLILNGSPRKKGDTVTLIYTLRKKLKGEVHQVNAYFDDISPCIDCRYCWKHDHCAIKDGMEPVYQWLIEANAFVIASPLYFSELTGPLLSILSRLQLFFSAAHIRKDPDFSIKPKRGALLLAGGGSTKKYDRAMETARLIFQHTNTEMIGYAIAGKTDHLPASQDSQALETVERIASLLSLDSEKKDKQI